MVYLVIMFLVAAAGLASLWVQQRRQRAHLETADGFRSSLERLSAAPVRTTRTRALSAAPRKARPTTRPVQSGRGRPRVLQSGRGRPAMDPARRAAAKKRIEARRRAAARARAL